MPEKMRVNGFFLFAFIFLSTMLSAQAPWCTSADVHQEMLKNPALASRFQQLMQQYEQSLISEKKESRTLVTIPVVVHVVHDGDSIGQDENISDAQIFSQMDVLNRDYRKLNPDSMHIPTVFKPLASDFEIEFCLAQRDPNGNPTSGIERINGGRSTWNTTLADAFKPSTVWNPNEYLNIWVMRLGGTSANTLGYAQFPWMPDSTDGIVIDYKAFGTIGDLLADHDAGKTATHEVGHWLGLFHTWGDDIGACSMDDNVADTPVQGYENYGCPIFPHVSCNNGPNGDMFMNYMDYVDDDCSSMFTVGQKAVVDFFFGTDRSAILSSQACVPTTVNALDMALAEMIFPTEEICTEQFTPLIRVRNLGSAAITSLLLNYQVDGTGLNQVLWAGYISTYDYHYIALPELTFTLGAHSLYVYLSAPNGGLDQNVGNEDAIINFNVNSTGNGNAIPAAENFESGALPAEWAVKNPDGDRTWKPDTVGSSGTFFSMMYDNFTGTGGSNPRGTRDGLVTPEFDFQGANFPSLSFDVAYARRNTTSKDSLLIYYSLDCGTVWKRLWAKGGAAFATAPATTAAYVPQPAEWREEQVPVGELSGLPKVQFKFENYSDWGNNLYLDNFKVNLATASIESKAGANEISLNIYPNPNDGNFSIELKPAQPDDCVIRIYSISGQKLSEHSIHEKKVMLSGFSAGIYIVHAQSISLSIYHKIVVK